jgi:hypothetical protein
MIGNLQVPIVFHYSIYRQPPAMIPRVQKAKVDKKNTIYRVNLCK